MVHAITYFSFISASIYGCFQDLVCLQKSRDGQIIIKILFNDDSRNSYGLQRWGQHSVRRGTRGRCRQCQEGWRHAEGGR